MNDQPAHFVVWHQLGVYPTLIAAELDAAYLRSEGILARAELWDPTLGHGTNAKLMVEAGSEDRARWFMKFEPVSEAELEFLATGDFPKSKGEGGEASADGPESGDKLP
jgi:hypothetical protein